MTIYSPNLVVNGDFSQGNIGFVSDYSYVVFNNSETQYMIQPVSKLSGLNIWGTNNLSAVSTDPLGGDGNVLYANGATEPNKLVWGETVSVTPNTDYVFTFYAVDANSGGGTDHEPYDAVLLGSVNGVASVQLNTNATWQQATLIWNSGSNTTAHLSLVDLNTSGGANDFAVDLISFVPSSPVANPDSGRIQKGNTLTVNAASGVLANDIDPNINDHLTVASVDGNAGDVGQSIQGQYGSLTLNADGSYSYVANNSSLPSQIVPQDVFTYSVSDGHGGTSSSLLTVTVLNPSQSYQSGSNTTLTGGNGKSVLDGIAGHDILQGGNGPDVLIGGPGDQLTGGNGPDIFAFGEHFGKNTITDFDVHNDTLQFSQSVFASVTDVLNHTADSASGAVITDSAGDQITLTGITKAQLTTASINIALLVQYSASSLVGASNGYDSALVPQQPPTPPPLLTNPHA